MQTFLHISTFLSLLLFWPRTTLGAALTPRPDLPSINQPNAFANVNAPTLMSSVIPEDFDLTILTPHGSSFDHLDCLESAVLLLARLAVMRFNTVLNPQSWRLKGITVGVSVAGATPGTRGVPSRYIIWGLYNAIRTFIAANDWRGVAYRLIWQGHVVGVLGIYKNPGSTEQLSLPSNEDHTFDQLKLNSSLSTLPVSNISSLAALSSPATPANTDFSLEFYFKEESSAGVNEYEIYRNMLNVLVNIAPRAAASAITRPEWFSDEDSTARIIVKGPETPKPMTRAPFFTWENLTEALVLISDTLVRERYFKSFAVKLKVREIEIGSIHVVPMGGAPTVRRLPSASKL
ncbi:MAG: hypothetical protein Q9221_009174 [Calogaya cf. arnoldii]